MKATKYVLKIACTLWLIFAIYHIIGYFTGRVPFHREDSPAMILGGISGGIGAWVVVKRMNFRKAQGRAS